MSLPDASEALDEGGDAKPEDRDSSSFDSQNSEIIVASLQSLPGSLGSLATSSVTGGWMMEATMPIPEEE